MPVSVLPRTVTEAFEKRARGLCGWEDEEGEDGEGGEDESLLVAAVAVAEREGWSAEIAMLSGAEWKLLRSEEEVGVWGEVTSNRGSWGTITETESSPRAASKLVPSVSDKAELGSTVRTLFLFKAGGELPTEASTPQSDSECLFPVISSARATGYLRITFRCNLIKMANLILPLEYLSIQATFSSASPYPWLPATSTTRNGNFCVKICKPASGSNSRMVLL